jgi:putative transposase
MIEQPNPLPLTRQCELMGLSRAALYYCPVEVSAEELELMALIDRQYLRTPFYGSRRMAAWLQTQGHMVNRKRVQRLMRLMGIEAIYQRPRTSRPAPEHRIYPYLLRGLTIERVNQVWAADICYIPMAHGFVYLVAVMDWVSRCVLAWRLSNLLDSRFCVEALEDALSKGRPEIFNTDQGSQFTGDDFIDVLRSHGIAISMDGRGRFSDNIFVERLWRSLKYEEVYLKAYQSVAEARHSIAAYFDFYNHERLHQALGYRVPRQVFEEARQPTKLRRGRKNRWCRSRANGTMRH